MGTWPTRSVRLEPARPRRGAGRSGDASSLTVYQSRDDRGGVLRRRRVARSPVPWVDGQSPRRCRSTPSRRPRRSSCSPRRAGRAPRGDPSRSGCECGRPSRAERSAVAEGDLDIGSRVGTPGLAHPDRVDRAVAAGGTRSKSRTGAMHRPDLRLAPEDPGQALGFLISPEVLDVPLGGEALRPRQGPHPTPDTARLGGAAAVPDRLRAGWRQGNPAGRSRLARPPRGRWWTEPSTRSRS